MRLDRLGGAALAISLVTACGSTVQTSATTQGDPLSPAGSGVRATEGAVAGSPAGATRNPVTSPGLPAAASTVGGSGVPGISGSPAARGPAIPPPKKSGFGFTAKEIQIGVAYDSTLSTELGSAGVSTGSASVGDQKLQVQALVDDLNQRGGISGRKVVPVFYDTKGTASDNNPNTIAQAACSYWTQDHQVWAAMTYVVQMDNRALYSCLASHRVIFMPLAGEAAATFARYAPFLWSPAGVTPEQVAPLWASRLKALGWFQGWDTSLGQPGPAAPVIGLLYGNGVRNNQPELDDSFRAAVKAALSRYGYKIATEAQITANQASESSAVLRFASAHVTHVIGDYSMVNFTQSAESQSYHPRYAISSFAGGVAMKLYAPPDQLRGALGIGWVPSGDVEADRDPGTPAATHCKAVMQKANQNTSVRLAWFAMTWACDVFSFLEHTVPGSGLDPTQLPVSAVRAGRLSGAFTFAMQFRQDKPYGVAVARDYAWNTSCSCFVYTSTTDHPL